MILQEMEAKNRALHLSRVCGDDPEKVPRGRSSNKFVPRMRG